MISVYLPTDYGMSAGEHSFLHCLNELAGFVSAKRCDYLLIAGDFNVDFSPIHRQRTSFLSDMMKDFDLEAVDLQYSTAVQFTYERDDGGAHSWVDHFLISSSLMSSVCRVASLHSGSNLSDHVPLTLTLECSGPVVRAPTSTCAFVQHQAWYKASEDDFIRYKIEVEKCMTSLYLEDHIVDCCDPSCSTHSLSHLG